MLQHSLAFTACALTAQAFLIPLEVANSAIESSNNFHVSVINPSSQTVKLDCPGCPFAEPTGQDGSRTWVSDVKSSLILDFTADDKHLSLNGVPFYPASIFVPEPLVAPQIRAEEDLAELKAAGYPAPLQLSYGLEFGPEKEFPGHEGPLIPIHLKIIAIDGREVNVDTVFLQALKTSSGKVSALSSKLPVVKIANAGDSSSSSRPRQSRIVHRAPASKSRPAKRKNARCHPRSAARTPSLPRKSSRRSQESPKQRPL